VTIPKHLLLLVAATVSTFCAVSPQAQIWDEGDESVIRVGEEVFAAGDTLSLGGNSGLTWAAAVEGPATGTGSTGGRSGGGSGLTLTLSRACHPGAAHEKIPAAAMQAGLFAGLVSRGD